MPKYLFAASYTPEGLKGLLSEGGTGRSASVSQLAESVGGSVESFYFAFGGDDAYIVCDLPDDETAASIGITVGATGKASVRTITLLTPEQVDAATKRSPAYRPPGA